MIKNKEPTEEKEPGSSFPSDEKEPMIDRIFMLVDRYSSRNEAARAWGINESTLKNYYKRRHLNPTPRRSQLLKIAECEGVSIEWLMAGGQNLETKEPKRTPVPRRLGDSAEQNLFGLLSILTNDEKQAVFEILARKGVETILYLLDEGNIRLLQLPDEEKECLLVRHEAKKGVSEDSRGNDFTDPMSKQAG